MSEQHKKAIHTKKIQIANKYIKTFHLNEGNGSQVHGKTIVCPFYWQKLASLTKPSVAETWSEKNSRTLLAEV